MKLVTFRTREAQESGDRAAQVIWVPLLAYARYLDDPELNSRIVDLDQYYEDAATGNLPAVAYIAPSGNSEHPPGSVRAGQRLVAAPAQFLERVAGGTGAERGNLAAPDDFGDLRQVVRPGHDLVGKGDTILPRIGLFPG